MAEHHLIPTAASEKDRLITSNVFQSDNQSSSRYDRQHYFSLTVWIFLIKNKNNLRKLISQKVMSVGNAFWLKYTNYYIFIFHIYRREV